VDIFYLTTKDTKSTKTEKVITQKTSQRKTVFTQPQKLFVAFVFFVVKKMGVLCG